VGRAKRAASGRGTRTIELEAAPKRKAKAEKVERREDVLERVLEKVAPLSTPRAEPQPLPVRAAPAVPTLRTARLVSLPAGKAEIAFRGAKPVEAVLAEGVERELLRRAMVNRDVVLVEWTPDAVPVVVGVVQTRTPNEVVIAGQKVTIDAEEELTLRSGTAAMRLRADGDVEVVGSRIAMASRGLFRLVGRMLRLN
jgi:hypothetical protein